MRKLCALAGALMLAYAPGTALAGGNPHGTGGNPHGSSSGQTSTSGQTSSSGQASTHAQGNASTTGTSTSPQPRSRADQNAGGANGGCPGTTKGDYCSTRNGSPSMNGNGKGRATGKPCAGCVGKADNKNPKGQFPNGSDHNNGYECDGNHGIGRTNPAHTGCTTTTTRTSTSPAPCTGSSASSSSCTKSPPPSCASGSGSSANCSPSTPPPSCASGNMPPGQCSSTSPSGLCTSAAMNSKACFNSALAGKQVNRPGSKSAVRGAGAIRPTHTVRRPAKRPTPLTETTRKPTRVLVSVTTPKRTSAGTLPFTGLDVVAVVLTGLLLVGLGVIQRRATNPQL